MNKTERLAMPLLAPGQAQKELVHNEAILSLDLLVGGSVNEPPRNDPPTSPVAGDCFLIGAAPTGDWNGRSGQIAAFTSAGWRYIAPAEGLTLLIRSTGEQAVRRSGGWDIGDVRCARVTIGGQQVVGPRSAAIPNPSGGSQIDSEARAAIGEILSALRAHGLVAS